MTSSEYKFGFLFGVVIVLLIAVIVALFLRRRNGGFVKEYDERQQLARGSCYRAAFWTLAAYSLLNGLLTGVMEIHWADPLVAAFIGFCLASTVFVALCIRRDAYFALSEKPGYYIRLFTLIGALELVLTVIKIVRGDAFVENGQLTFDVMSLVVLGMYLVLLPLLIWRQRQLRREDEE